MTQVINGNSITVVMTLQAYAETCTGPSILGSSQKPIYDIQLYIPRALQYTHDVELDHLRNQAFLQKTIITENIETGCSKLPKNNKIYTI